MKKKRKQKKTDKMTQERKYIFKVAEENNLINVLDICKVKVPTGFYDILVFKYET